ncbi:MAG: proline--tRNA ligase [Proteobacteria bacterium]|nr:proline--tRNA ligase [Pseudomonadota bacterium]
MKLSKLLGRRSKETPREATSISHKYLLRGGYVRPVSSGIYSILPLGMRVLRKIESVIRQEMEKIGGQEVLMPVVMPRELWEESGRYDSIDQSMVRFKDRNLKDFVLGMTHEEAVLALARTEVSSYKQLPFMLYQIQTKFRDEARPRGGLIRVREFTMKDAYSFHHTEDDLKAYYEDCYRAYERIFRSVGIKNLRVVKSDTGMMGGSVAHEFMLETSIGEDTLVICDSCGYAANNEVATCTYDDSTIDEKDLEDVKTPGMKTIDELCDYLKIDAKQTAKAIFFQMKKPDASLTLIFCIIRGDKVINDAKLAKILKTDLYEMASEQLITSIGAVPGYASPIGLVNLESCIVIVDKSVMTSKNLVTGANKQDLHCLNFNVSRDIQCRYIVDDIAQMIAGDLCVQCQEPLRLTRGIEIGNIFQLGTKYTKSMNMTFLDESGGVRTPVMGCYGIGIGRLMASVIEDCHDDRGPNWPWRIAPYQIHICALNSGELSVSQRMTSIYEELTIDGFEVLLDDTQAQPGVQFADADLIGAPIRLVVSPRNESRGTIEYMCRYSLSKGEVRAADLLEFCRDQRRLHG